MLLENPDNYFDNEERKARIIWKRMTIKELERFSLERFSKKGVLYSSVDLPFEHKKMKHGIVVKTKLFDYHIELK